MRPAPLHDDPRRPSASCCCCCGCCSRGPRPRRPRLALWLRRMLCLGAEAAGTSSPASSATPGGLNAASDTMLLDSSDQELVVRRSSAVQRASSASSGVSDAAPQDASSPLDDGAATSLYIRMIASPGSAESSSCGGGSAGSSPARSLSDADWLLLEGLDTRLQRTLHTGRFLTMHKRRRRRLNTRSAVLGGGQPALLDDIHHGQVQFVLNKVGDWPFNAFILDTVTGGRSLPVLCVHLFHWYGLFEHFQLDVVRVWKLFTLIEEGYHGTNPYHNAIHATDVTQAMHCFLQEEKIRSHLTPLEIMSALLAAVTHDLDHPGVNQPFLIATSNHLAALYENTSVLENHHWRSAIGCLLESCVAQQMGANATALEQQISSLILATDITRQQEFLTRFKRYLECDMLDMSKEEDRHFILQIALKCADISNPCRPWDISKKWSQKICEEFFRQGDYERQLSLPVTSLCDRHSNSVPKIQAGFFQFVVAPLMHEWENFLISPLAKDMMGHLRTNQTKWETLLTAEMAEETKTEVSEADDLEDEQDLVQIECPPTLQPISAAARRHSVPLSVSHLAVARTIIRRESLPDSRTGPRFPLETILHIERGEGSSTLSLFSEHGTRLSNSGSVRSLGPPAPAEEQRPVSAENLLPEPSIASITTSSAAVKLSSVLHPSGRHLTRQQTFPPLHPSCHPATRYRHSTAGAEVLREASDSSVTSSISSCHSESRELVPAKREPPAEPERERAERTKIAKLEGKENRAPSDKPRKSIQGSSRLQCRRGSAPVSLCKMDVDSLKGSSPPLEYRLSRRGSVPCDGSRQTTGDAVSWTKHVGRRFSGGGDSFETDLAKRFSGKRRGSLPTELRPRDKREGTVLQSLSR
ncbi:high affinity cAMP-specific 3',5'-cyclic phosphodiesterase 7A-like isoform X2 [Neocloeon triangulifer]|uniref:high affinity cAMP-specific 3',5'-cyclic phosphodiesterase 7A-like isoform X2 n=1 Tax=Neocloeon triangulifer TaxID=2078957 RepID=UPI00286F040F|nr:high affinity cAMP-specific 3',5'-cyclic phosphodiesterase 7A-like isoform X2 [Neocloeon triangulifer]